MEYCKSCDKAAFKAGRCQNLYDHGDCKGQTLILKDTTVPERNSPCHCGSVKKYKKCCYNSDQKELAEPIKSARNTTTTNTFTVI